MYFMQGCRKSTGPAYCKQTSSYSFLNGAVQLNIFILPSNTLSSLVKSPNLVIPKDFMRGEGDGVCPEKRGSHASDTPVTFADVAYCIQRRSAGLYGMGECRRKGTSPILRGTRGTSCTLPRVTLGCDPTIRGPAIEIWERLSRWMRRPLFFGSALL